LPNVSKENPGEDAKKMVQRRRTYIPVPNILAESGRFIMVELPAQFGGSKPKNSPVLICSETSLRAITVVNDVLIF